MEALLHSPDEPFDPLPEARQSLLDRFKQYAVWHPRLVQVQTQLLDTICPRDTQRDESKQTIRGATTIS